METKEFLEIMERGDATAISEDGDSVTIKFAKTEKSEVKG